MLSSRRALLVCLAAGPAACGARTGLPAPGGGGAGGNSGDALPPVQVAPVPIGAEASCVDAGSTLIYVVTQAHSLMSFYPPTATFTRIGTLICPVTLTADASPFSMAVDRAGTAYVVYNDGELFRVSTATAACEATGFVSSPARTGFTTTFGMGYSTNVADGGEVLYVASAEDVGSRLATLDTRTFALAMIGRFDSAITKPELTGTGAGDLFAFYAIEPNTAAAYSAIAQVDRSTARSAGQSSLAGVVQGSGWAFAVWGGDFYTFTSPDRPTPSAHSVVTRFRPVDGSIVPVAQSPDQIVGAGVSTCAPQP